MITFSPTINFGFGKKTDKTSDTLEPKPATPIQQAVGPIQVELSDPALLLMLMAIVLLSSAALVYAARH
jgi:hypothetical protein